MQATIAVFLSQITQRVSKLVPRLVRVGVDVCITIIRVYGFKDNVKYVTEPCKERLTNWYPGTCCRHVGTFIVIYYADWNLSTGGDVMYILVHYHSGNKLHI